MEDDLDEDPMSRIVGFVHLHLHNFEEITGVGITQFNPSTACCLLPNVWILSLEPLHSKRYPAH